MWYSGRKARKEGGKIKRWDQHTGFFLSRTFVSSSGQWQKKSYFFSKTFLPMMLTHTRGVSKCFGLFLQYLSWTWGHAAVEQLLPETPPHPTLWRYPLSLVTIYMIIHREDKSIPGKLISGYNMVWIQDLIERNTPRGVIVIF